MSELRKRRVRATRIWRANENFHHRSLCEHRTAPRHYPPCSALVDCLSMGSTWTCQLCTKTNDLSLLKCSFCMGTAPSKSPTIPSPSTPAFRPPSTPNANSRFIWQCRHCTLFNPFRMDVCNSCSAPRFQGKTRSRSPQLPSSSSTSFVPNPKRIKLDETGT